MWGYFQQRVKEDNVKISSIILSKYPKRSEVKLNAPYHWRYKPLDPKDICVLDCEMVECGGEQQVISIAILDINGQKLFNKNMRPPGNITNAHKEIHNMSQEHIEGLDSAYEFKRRIEDTLYDKTIVGFAIHNDLKVKYLFGVFSKFF